MKSYKYIILIGCILLIACKKDHSSGNMQANTTTHKVVFNAVFSQQTANFNINSINTNHLTTNTLTTNAADTSLTNHVSVMIYAIYNSAGVLVNIKTQSSTDSNFGSYGINLGSGTYTVVVAAGGNGLILTPASNFNSDILNYGKNQFNQDTFVKQISITVSDTDAVHSVNLDRIMSKLTIVIKDVLPPNVKVIYANFAAGDSYSLKNKAQGSGSFTPTMTSFVPAASLGTKNYKFSALLLPPTYPFSIQIFGLSGTTIPTDGSIPGTTIGQKAIYNPITCLPNAETILSGSLFGGAGSNSGDGFSLTIDTAYNSTPIVINFPQ